MSDEQIIKQMIESKAQQNLRQHINEGKEFNPSNAVEQKVLDNYNQMTEQQQQQFNAKGWKND